MTIKLEKQTNSLDETEMYSIHMLDGSDWRWVYSTPFEDIALSKFEQLKTNPRFIKKQVISVCVVNNKEDNWHPDFCI
jgi:hypothetical protein